jgi:hypothetical protein
MPALVSRAVLDALVDPRFQAELPAPLRKQINSKVTAAGKGDYGTLTLGSSAKAVREAAKRLRAKPRVPAKLAKVLPELERLPGY